MEKIIILDFGSQTSQLIGRRIRDMGVYTEIYPGDISLTSEILEDVKGIVLSGSPYSVYSSEGPVPDQSIYTCGLPLFGICYGLQRITKDNGGVVEALPEREFGNLEILLVWPAANAQLLGDETLVPGFFSGFNASLTLKDIIDGNIPDDINRKHQPAVTLQSWMSHGDTITKLAPGFKQYGTSIKGAPAVLVHETKPWMGVQFHPEVTHCERGNEIIAGFVFGVCKCSPGWTMEQYIEEVRDDLKNRVGTNPVLLLISGGVDSTVAGALLLKTLNPDQVHLMYMDTGLMRKNETATVKVTLEKLGAKHLHIIHCEDEFLGALKGVEEPEAKRKAIGDLFIQIQEREVARLGLPADCFLAQGTLYTDLIESGKGVGKKAHVIKSHHNVRSPLVEEKRRAGKIIEPLDRLYKDEVRALGRILGIDEEVVRRHPFPGPGLAVRILGEVTKDRCDILREADAIYINELKRRGLYDDIWQAFAILLPIRSVGVAGDVRKYGWVLALRAISSTDGMTADVYPFHMKDLLEMSTLITNQVSDIGRVTYDISSKPPATIEWE